ncbi:MAG: hypothetical protein Q8P82_02910 [bacterium]|nr:hypothetical protein [bacterium]
MAHREVFKRIFIRDAVVRFSLIIAAILLVLLWAFLLWRGLPLRGNLFIPLHYNIYFGIDLIGPWYGIFAPAVFGTAALLLNSLLLLFLYERRRFLAHATAVGTLLLQVLFCVAAVFSVLLNT